jgi:serine protease AprX
MGGTTALAISPGIDGRRVRFLGRTLVSLLAFGLAATFVRSIPPSPDLFFKADPALLAEATARPGSTLSVIVREAAPTSSDAERLVRSLGGDVTRELTIVGGFAAHVPAGSLTDLVRSTSIAKIWGDGRIDMAGDKTGKYDSSAPNAVWRQVTKLNGGTASKYNGAGVGVALVDTGVVPVPDLVNRVAYRVDLTSEVDGYDRFGHGTHLAGIIAGDGTSSGGATRGVAPAANLISVKVAGWDGATDVSVVIGGLQWIVSHRTEYNIRVANLSFGTNSKQPYALDPLDYAVEQVWFSGILVVVSAGNQGQPGAITKPGDDPYVLTVGAADLKNTLEMKDDTVADFSSAGPTQDGFLKPDIYAPGITIVSDRDPGSTIDQLHPSAILNDSYIKGTGTSQAAAIVSGVAALMFQAAPGMTPDVAKATLVAMTTDKAITGVPGPQPGLVSAEDAVKAAIGGLFVKMPANQGLVPSTGLGSLEASRGSLHVYADLDGDGVPELVTGEIDVLGRSWVANGWGANSWGANSWGGSSWSANGWGANSWGGMSWDANSWGANGWGANSWGANGWGANGWGANGWGANSWGANAWGSDTWS